MSGSSMNEIVFRKNPDTDDLIPVFVSGTRCRRLTVRNLSAFSSQIAEGETFAVNVIEIRGSGANPQEIVVEIERHLVRIKDEKWFGEEFWIHPEMLQMILADIQHGHHLLFRGPKGTGKTTLAKMLAQSFKVPYLKVDSAGISKPKDLFGSDSATDGTLRWIPSDLTLFLDEHRSRTTWPKGIILLDEFNRMGHSMSPFHPIFDHTASFAFTTTQGTVTVKDLRGFIWIMAINPSDGGHIGTSDLDEALEDRTEIYDFDYPEKPWEIAWLIRQTSITQAEAEQIVNIAAEVRGFATSQHMAKGGPSPRRTLHTARMVRCGIPLQMAMKYKIINRYAGSLTEPMSDRALVTERLRSSKLLSDVGIS